MRAMKVGDQGFFYHSNAGVLTGIVGTVTVVREAYTDASCLDPKSKYYDAKSTAENPRWSMVDVKLHEKWTKPLLLSELKAAAAAAEGEGGGDRTIADMKLLQRGMRLSVQPLSDEEWSAVLRIAKV